MPGSKVLVVEDDPLILMSAAQTLRLAGFAVLEAETAEEAAALLKAIDGEVDAVFTDIETPGAVDGLGLAKMVSEAWPAVSVIVTSGRVRPAPAVLPAGARFVSKPYDLSHVAALIAGRALP